MGVQYGWGAIWGYNMGGLQYGGCDMGGVQHSICVMRGVHYWGVQYGWGAKWLRGTHTEGYSH